MLVKLDHFPKVRGKNKKRIWNHHLVSTICLFNAFFKAQKLSAPTSTKPWVQARFLVESRCNSPCFIGDTIECAPSWPINLLPLVQQHSWNIPTIGNEHLHSSGPFSSCLFFDAEVFGWHSRSEDERLFASETLQLKKRHLSLVFSHHFCRVFLLLNFRGVSWALLSSPSRDVQNRGTWLFYFRGGKTTATRTIMSFKKQKICLKALPHSKDVNIQQANEHFDKTAKVCKGVQEQCLDLKKKHPTSHHLLLALIFERRKRNDPKHLRLSKRPCGISVKTGWSANDISSVVLGGSSRDGRKWFITMAVNYNTSPLSRVEGTLENGHSWLINGGDPNYLPPITTMILQVGIPIMTG